MVIDFCSIFKILKLVFKLQSIIANEETARLIKMSKGEAIAYHVDLTKREDIYRAAEHVKKQVGKVRI